MAPVIRECRRRGLDHFVLHTGQHYSYEMDRVFFEQLELPAAEYNLDAGSGTHADQTGRIMSGIEKVLMKAEPDVVLVQGDTNTVLAGALAVAKSAPSSSLRRTAAMALLCGQDGDHRLGRPA
jgi:UDP-N-acetylglucosamine 2-epimerase (non-hydrolysing)